MKKTAGSREKVRVVVIMGSDSDLKALSPCLETLENFGVKHDVFIASAHRTHDYLKRIVKKFDRDGGQVVIAAAGGAGSGS